MIRFIERNGYDASYMSQADADRQRRAAAQPQADRLQRPRRVLVGRERANVEAARDAGVSLAFFSGNEVFWKTRWQSSSADGSPTPYRTLTSYKDTHFDAPTDPAGVDRHLARPALQPARRRRQAQNSLTGQLFIINSGSSDIRCPRLQEPAPVAQHRGGEPRRGPDRGRWRRASRRSATSGTSTSTTASGRAASSGSPRPR